MWKYNFFPFLTLAVLYAFRGGQNDGVDALRLRDPAVITNSDILMVGQPARLTCNYLKASSEKVREIIWYAGYAGINSKVL